MLFRSKHVRTLIHGPLSVKEMQATIDAMEATIKDAIAKEPAAKSGMGMGFPGGKPMGLRDFVARRNESVRAQLEGKSQGKPLAMNPPGRPGVPDEARRQIAQTLGPPFLVFRDKVQEELKLTDEQKKNLEKRLQHTVQDAMQCFQNLQGAKPEEREKEHHAYVQKSQEKLTAFLEGALKEEQFKRLRQVMLQQEGLFALGNAAVMKELEITDKQRLQFVEVSHHDHLRCEPGRGRSHASS